MEPKNIVEQRLADLEGRLSAIETVIVQKDLELTNARRLIEAYELLYENWLMEHYPVRWAVN